MRLFLAGRLPVTSKGAALNHLSQPRGRALRARCSFVGLVNGRETTRIPFLPFGATATPAGKLPRGIGEPINVFVVVSITETVFEFLLEM